jgi:hypothetical protein
MSRAHRAYGVGVRLTAPLPRLLVTAGWILACAADAVLAEQTLISASGHYPWWVVVDTIAAPTSLAVIAVGWWFLGSVSLTTGADLRRATWALLAFGAQALLMAVVPVVLLSALGRGGGGWVFVTTELLRAAGGVTVAAGLLAAVAHLRAAVLDLPGVVGDVVPDLAQAETEGPAPVG